MNSKPKFFAILTANVRYADISDFAKILYAEISAMTNVSGYCFASNKYFADLFNKSEQTIKVSISKLKKHNFVRCEYVPHPNGTRRKIYLLEINPQYKNVPTVQKCTEGGYKNVHHNNTSINKEEKEAANVVEEHKELVKKIAVYLDSEQGKMQINYWMQTAMFKGDIKEAIEDFTNYWWGEGHQMFKNNPVSFLNKKLVSWLKRRKKTPQKRNEMANKTINKECIEAYVDNTHGKKQRSLKKYYKEKYFNIEAFKEFKPTIKQSAFEFDMLHGKLQDTRPPRMRKAYFKKFYDSLTDNQRKFANSVELYHRYLTAI